MCLMFCLWQSVLAKRLTTGQALCLLGIFLSFTTLCVQGENHVAKSSQESTVVKPVFFISHATAEKAVAIALKALIERAFGGRVIGFVATDPQCLPFGSKWSPEIVKNLKKCFAFIMLASQESIGRPWVNFELGVIWERSVPKIPLCHSGMSVDHLPSPYHELMAGMATDEEDLQKLIGALALELGGAQPTVDFSEFIEVVKEYENSSVHRRILS